MATDFHEVSNGQVVEADHVNQFGPPINAIEDAKGQANGYASLGSDGKVPSAQLPATGGATSLGDLSDAEVTSPAAGQVLRYDGTEFINAVLDIDDVDGLSAALASAGGTVGGNLADLQALSLAEGDILTVDASGDLIQLAAGDEGHVLQIVSGVPAWGEPVGGGGGGDFLVTDLVAYGTRYSEITSTSDNLTSSPFTPELGRQYLIRWMANHTNSVAQLNLASAVTNSQPHFCRAVEVGDSTIHNIGFSGPTATDYTCSLSQRTRTHEFVWTATTANPVQIVLGQPSLDYGEFTGTLLIYEVKAGATNLGWGTYSTGYSWLADSTNGANSLGSGSYLSGVSLDSSKTYAFLGNWCQGCSIKLVLRQGTNYYRLPPNSDTWAAANSTDSAWDGGMYYEWDGNLSLRGEFVRLFSPPSTGTFDIGCGFWSIVSGCFWLVEIP